MNVTAPVVVYTYNRIDHLKQTISALEENYLASKTDLFIVSDGAKDKTVSKEIEKLREYVESINGFGSVNKIFRPKNLGAFESITQAEKSVVSDYGRVISLEDDIVTSKNFLNFINSGLNYFEDYDKVTSVSGYCHPIEINTKYDSWMSIWHCPWGYGTWKKKYNKFDYSSNKYLEVLKYKKKSDILNRYGDFFIDTLIADLRGKIIAADARVCINMLLVNNLTVMPKISKVKNIGCDGSGLHSAKTNKFDVDLDDGSQVKFEFKAEFDWNDEEFMRYCRFMNGTNLERAVRRIKRSFKNTLYYTKTLNYFEKLLK